MPANQICPKCSYQRKPADDQLVSKNECPNCGIIYAKVGPKNPPGEAPSKKSDNAQAASTPVSQPKAGMNPMLLLGGIGIIAAVLVYFLFFRSDGSSPPVDDMAKAFDIEIPGKYVGEFDNEGRVSTLEFEIDAAYRVCQLSFKDNRAKHFQKEVEWRFPNYIKAVTYNWKSDGRGNMVAVRLEQRMERDGQNLTIETIQDGETHGPYLFQSDQLADDAPKVALLKPTADKKSLYGHFNLHVPAFGQVPRPDNYHNRIFRGTESEFRHRCSPGISFAGSLIQWSTETVCRFDFKSLMRCNILFRPAEYKKTDPSLKNPQYRKHYEFEAHDDIKFEFRNEYIDPVAIWIGKTGYGQARVEGNLLPFAIRKADLPESGQAAPTLKWDAMNVHYQLNNK